MLFATGLGACATTEAPYDPEAKYRGKPSSAKDHSDYELRYLDRMLGTRKQISPKMLQEAMAAAAEAEAQAQGGQGGAPGGGGPEAEAPPAPPEMAPTATASNGRDIPRPATPRQSSGSGGSPGSSGSSGSAAPAIPREQVREVISSHYSDIQACYERMLAKNPKFKGRLVLKFVVGPQGNVLKTAVERDRNTPPAQELQACMVKLAAKWKFPPPGGKRPVTVVSDPFAFE